MRLSHWFCVGVAIQVAASTSTAKPRSTIVKCFFADAIRNDVKA